ncbi:uncharacterized protein BDZ99DRAFT_448045 [Mytilinidion resinicola]|uniref:Telomere length regulation protein conserved domain-containing protein n=1 Tax=Mytilinidion resinicola TaxID=574789 RepID=A0A6A6YCT4_9PEZI|nr:uncharacterized protein BDZ99DRAFT_448045 [Mytilinidion resinicola]KAF2806631.1 hypothetical protein BDZ99DRAFT_448045 [Mytilinidion resinicola]
MDDFLKPVRTISTVKDTPSAHGSSNQQQGSRVAVIESPEDVLGALKTQPDYETVGEALRYLSSAVHSKQSFSILLPGALAAQIIHILVGVTIPDYWRSFTDSSKDPLCRNQIIRCLQSVSGIGAVIARLKLLIADAKQSKPAEGIRNLSQHIEDLLDVLSRILGGDEISWQIWTDVILLAPNTVQQTLIWKEYVSQTASGKVLAIAAEAEDTSEISRTGRKDAWLAQGREYATWLGRNIVGMIKRMRASSENEKAGISTILGKALMLGHTGKYRLISPLLSELSDPDLSSRSQSILQRLAAYQQRQFMNSTIVCLSKNYLDSIPNTKDEVSLKRSRMVSGVAGLIHSLIRGNDVLSDYLVSILTGAVSGAVDMNLACRRSMIAALSTEAGRLQAIMDRSLASFGDQMYIRHTPILHQEALSQTLLLACGYVHRSQPTSLAALSNSSVHRNGMSNRIGASSPRARFLGIVVGTVISEFVDTPDKRMKFELDKVEAGEVKWYKQLTQVQDPLGNPSDLISPDTKRTETHDKSKQNLKKTQQQPKAPHPKVGSKRTAVDSSQIVGPRIVEILDSSEDDDLVPYGKPDSDPEDEDDDPTMVQRNKPTAPVYIRDLIAGLKENEDYDRHQLALSTAAILIRKKVNFGKEVTDHIEQLASTLVGLNDPFELENFSEMRQKALIATLLAQPAQMGQWFARSFFSGDYSLTQRVAMLTTMGLGARELAGLENSSTGLTTPTSSFPSKILPPKLHKLYAAEATPVAALSNKMEHLMLSPMAASAADSLTGPNALKIRTFSSRMAVEAKRKKPIPNALAAIVAQNFFFPLTGRWWTHMQASDPDNIYTSPHLLPPFLQTLAILLNASGPSTLSLPQMTSELWDLLLSVRGAAVQDPLILAALLFALLTLLETNEDKQRLAREHAKELLETQEWVRGVFERLGAGAEEDEKVRMLAAGVMVRCHEVVEKYQRTMAGDMMDY